MDSSYLVRRLLGTTRRFVLFLVLIVLFFGLGAAVIFLVFGKTEEKSILPSSVTLPVTGDEAPPIGNSLTQKLTVNAQLQVNGQLYLTPTSLPDNAAAGTIVFDQSTSTLRYFNGTEFVSVADQSSIPQPVPSGVTSLQGATGALQFTPGPGIAISGFTISNNGLLGINGVSGDINVSTANGIASISLPQSIAPTASPSFNGLSLAGDLVLTTTGLIRTNLLQSVGVGQDIAIDAGVDNVTFISGGQVFQFPSTVGSPQTICTMTTGCPGGGGGSFVEFAPVSAQTDSSANVSIFINDTGGGNLIQLQANGADRFRVASNGDVTVGGTLTLGGALSVANGGTGAATLGANGVLIGNGTSAITSVTAGAAGLCLTSTVGAPVWQSCPGSGGIASLTLAGTSGTSQTITDGNTITIAAGSNITTTAGALDTLTVAVVSSPSFSSLTLSTALGISSGGTGATSAQGAINALSGLTTNGDLLYHNGTNATRLARGTNGQCLLSTGTTIQWSTCTGAGGVSSVNGFNGVVTVQGTTNQVIVNNSLGTITISTPQDINTGASPTFAGLTLSAPLGVASGGIGTASLTAGGVLFGNGTSAITASAVLTNGQLLIGDGSGAPTAATLTQGSGIQITNGAGSITVGVDATVCTTSGNCAGVGGTGDIMNNGQTGPVTIGTNNATSTVLETNNVARLTIDSSGAATFSGSLIVTGAATFNGNLTVELGDTFTINGDAFTDLTGDGLEINGGALGVDSTVCRTNGNCVGGGSGGAPNSAAYIVIGSDGTLTSERSIVAGTNLSAVDGGANGNYTLSVVSNPTFSGLITAQAGITITAGQTFTFNGDAFTDLTGTGLMISGGALQTTLGTSVDLASEITGTLPVANGGTGATTFTADGVLFGNGTGAVQSTAAGTTGQCLVATTGSAPSWGSCGAGVATVGTIDTQTASANGAVISGSSIYLQSASATMPGLVNTASQTFAGNKTFNGSVIIGAGSDNQLEVSGASTGQAPTLYGEGGINLLGESGGQINLSINDGGGGTINIGGCWGACGTTVNIGDPSSTTVNINSSGGALTLQSGSNIVLGVSDTTGTLLVLDTKTSSGDPSGVNGGMYYNSNAGKFRCYENSAWVDCISSGDGVGVTTLAAIGAAPNANGATISGSTLTLQPASGSFGGVVTTGTQTFSGTKIFNDEVTILGSQLWIGAGSGGAHIALAPSASGSSSIDFNNLSGTDHILFDNNTDTFIFKTGGVDRVSLNGAALNTTVGLTFSGVTTDITTGTNQDLNIAPNGTGSLTIGTSDTTATLLVLDTKTDSGDPTGVNGGMYYNSNANAFRFYQNGAWVSFGTGDVLQGGNSFGGTMTIGTNDSNSLSFETNNTTYFTLTTAGLLQGTNGATMSVPGTGLNSEAFGAGALAEAYGVALGNTANAYGYGAVALGYNTWAGGANSIAIGNGAWSDGDSIAIGAGAGADGDNQFVLGSSTLNFTNMYLGAGITDANASSKGITLQATSGGGTNVGGASLTLAGGQGTGNQGGGAIYFQTATLGSSGSDLNLLQTRLTIEASGNLIVGTADTVGSLLVLDTKTTANDPTGQAGGMYYNSNAGKFRCYEGVWKDCISPGDIINGGQNGAVTIGTNDVSSLIFRTDGTTRLTISTIGNITQNSGSLQLAGTNTGNYRMYMSGTVQSASGSVYGLQNDLTFNVSAASAVYGLINTPSIHASSAGVADVFGFGGRVDFQSGYAGTTSNAYGVVALRPNNMNGVKVQNYVGLGAQMSNSGSSGNSDNASGTLNNYGLRVFSGTAAAGAGGTLNNYGARITLSTGATSGTTNYGLYIDGNGGGSNNWALYSASSADSLIAGALQVNGQLTVGTVDSSATLLVLDTKTSANDPTGTNGAMYYNSNMGRFRCYENGAWKNCISGISLAVASTAVSSAISNTTSETYFSGGTGNSYTLAANECTAGKAYRVTASGTYSSTGTPSLTFRVRAGAVAVGDTSAIPVGTSASGRAWRIEFQFVCTLPPSIVSTVNGQGVLTLFTTPTTVTYGEMVQNSIFVNTASSMQLRLSAQWDTASASNTVTMNQFIVEALNP